MISLFSAGLVVIGFVALAAFGGSNVSTEARSLMDSAAQSYQKGDFDTAQSLYLKANEQAPNNPTILQKLGALALLNNRPAEAITYYADALRYTPWYERVWPLTADLTYHLGLAYYRMDDFAHAGRFFREAAGPFQAGPLADLKTVKGMSEQLSLFGTSTPYRIEGPQTTHVDFVVTDPLPVVSVSVNGSEPADFFLDTGGAEIILDDKFAQEVHAQIAGSLSGEYAGNKTAAAGLGKIDTFSIGDLVVHDVPVQVLNIASTSALFEGRAIKGIIGTRFLMHFLSTIDYKDGALVLRRIDTHIQPVAPEGKGIPFSLFDMHMLFAHGTVNGQGPMLFFIDTGLAGAGFTATEPLLNEYKIPVDWSKAKDSVGGAGAVRATQISVGQITLGLGENEVSETNVPGVAVEGGVPVVGDSLGFHVGGVISHSFFRQHAVTFDFKNMKLIVTD